MTCGCRKVMPPGDIHESRPQRGRAAGPGPDRGRRRHWAAGAPLPPALVVSRASAPFAGRSRTARRASLDAFARRPQCSGVLSASITPRLITGSCDPRRIVKLSCQGLPSSCRGGFGVSWTASAITLSAGEVLWFVADSRHSKAGGGPRSEEGAGDPIAFQTNISSAPEPSSFLRLGMTTPPAVVESLGRSVPPRQRIDRRL